MSNPELAPTAYEVLKFLVETLVNNPDEIQIDVSEDDDGEVVFMDVRVVEEDRGRVIGRRGRTANTIRTIINSASIKDDKVVEVDFLDD